MKKIANLTILLMLTCTVFAGEGITEISLEQVQAALEKSHVPHPRLFLTDEQLPAVMQRIQNNKSLTALHEEIIQQADALMKEEPLERKVVGVRLLGVSRDALRRLTMLSWAYRVTGKDVYLKRAEHEMHALAAFSDWHPSHFLDVAEMTTAMAIGYDWLYDGLSEESRAIIRKAIVEKGICPSLYENQRPASWISRNNNWNQVCHGGVSCGSLAVMEDEPELAETIIHRAVNKIQIPMGGYEPNGAYPEGPGYWVYGTTYNVLFLAALDSVLGTDFGLSQKNGFSKTGDYLLHATGPTGLFFNYPDCWPEPQPAPALFWLAQKYHNPSMAWNQQKMFDDAVRDDPDSLTKYRLAIFALLWSPDAVKPTALNWMGRGINPVAMFQTSWEPDATYLGIKGGTPGSAHAHMDIGSFVIDADGLRWALDFGPESYHKIESRGIGLWDGRQNGDRWTIFRYNNYSHNTLTVDGRLQQVAGFAPMIRYSSDAAFPHVVFDLTEVYKGQLAKAMRGASILPTGHVLIQDELTATDESANVRWAMATPAEVKILSDKKALLIQKDKTMQFEVLTDADVMLMTFTTTPRVDYDAENPDTRMIGFHVRLSPNQQRTIRVVMMPGSEEKSPALDMKNVETWSEPLE